MIERNLILLGATGIEDKLQDVKSYSKKLIFK
jgi:magnesium-transporting ATPase (P-type)